jgi:hypothetical protein
VISFPELRAAAAAEHVERAGQNYCDHDENHVEHEFLSVEDGLLFCI